MEYFSKRLTKTDRVQLQHVETGKNVTSKKSNILLLSHLDRDSDDECVSSSQRTMDNYTGELGG